MTRDTTRHAFDPRAIISAPDSLSRFLSLFSHIKSESNRKVTRKRNEIRYVAAGRMARDPPATIVEVDSQADERDRGSVQGNEYLNVADGEHPRLPVQGSLVPVVVDLLQQQDDVSLLEAQFAWVLGVEVVESGGTGTARDGGPGWRANRRGKR